MFEKIIDLIEKQPFVLFVDDEEHILKTLKANLRREINVLLANSAEEALEILKKEPRISVIVSDERMPGMKGHEFFIKSLEINPNLKKVLLTGYTDHESYILALEKGKMSQLINKPFDRENLLNVIFNLHDEYQKTA